MSIKSVVEIEYPSSDGKPMAESDLNRDWMVRILERLQWHFRGQRVYVSADLLIYYVEGNPKKHVAPDVFVVKDCDAQKRPTFKIWEEGRVPDFVLEATSKTTRRTDMGKKKVLYAELGVKEYFLYDPTGEWLKDLVAYQLSPDGEYVDMPRERDGSVISRELGVRFVLNDRQLEMYDADTGEQLLSASERSEVVQREMREVERKNREVELKNKQLERDNKESEKRTRELEQKASEQEQEIARLRKQLDDKQ